MSGGTTAPHSRADREIRSPEDGIFSATTEKPITRKPRIPASVEGVPEGSKLVRRNAKTVSTTGLEAGRDSPVLPLHQAGGHKVAKAETVRKSRGR